MHTDKTGCYLNQVLNWNSLIKTRIWYWRCFNIRIKRASASKPCKRHTLSQSSVNNFPQNHPATDFSLGLDQGYNWSSNWATTPPPAPGSHTWGGTSAGKLFSLSSVCSQQPKKKQLPQSPSGYLRVILPHFPHCFYEEPAEISSPWKSSFSPFKPKGALCLFLWWLNIHSSWGGFSGSHNKWEWIVWL